MRQDVAARWLCLSVEAPHPEEDETDGGGGRKALRRLSGLEKVGVSDWREHTRKDTQRRKGAGLVF